MPDELADNPTTEVIIAEGPGYTISRSDIAATSVPYGGVRRPSGDINHGWIDLRDHPERVAEVPEAAKSAGLAKLLRVIADPISKVMSSACECGAFDNSSKDGDQPAWQVGGFVITMFKDAERNTDPQNFVDLAGYLLNGIAPTTEHHIAFVMIIEPLRSFFGRSDCFALMIKPVSYGASESEAWAGFDYAAGAVADALGRDRPKAGVASLRS